MDILNLGLGKPRHYFPTTDVVNVDVWKPYLLGYKGQNILADVRFLPFKEKSFDVVLAIEIVEHLNYEEGKHLIKNIHSIARKLIIFSTPRRFFHSSELNGNPHQVHKSFFKITDFEGFTCVRKPSTNVYYKLLKQQCSEIEDFLKHWLLTVKL